jgi:ABC-type sugar transport system substrate-binding protein
MVGKHRIMPRIRITLAAVTLAGVALAAVSGAALATTPSATHGKSAQKANIKIAVVLHLRVPSLQTFIYGAKEAGKQLGFTVDGVGPQTFNNLEEQKIAQSEVDSGAKGLALLLVGAEAWRRPIAAWQKQGIRVVNVGIQTGAFMGKATPLLVAPRDIRTGQYLANITLGALGSKPTGEVVVGNPIPGLKLLEDRIKGFRQVFKQKAPGVKIFVANPADDNVKGVTDWQSLIDAHPNALAFVGLASTAPAILGKIHKDTHPKWIVTGCELDPRTPPLIQSGDIVGVTSAGFWKEGYIGARILFEQIAHNKYVNLHGWIDSGTEVVTKKNIATIVQREKSPANMAKFFDPLMAKMFKNIQAYLGPYT